MTGPPNNESLASDLRLAIQRAVNDAAVATTAVEARDWMAVAVAGLQHLPYVEKPL